MRALFCLCAHSCAKQMNTGLFRLPQPGQAPTMAWLSRNLLTTAEAGFPTVHREKTLALQTHDQGQSGPKNCTLPSQGRRLRVRGAQEGLSGNGAVSPGGSPDFWSHLFPAGLAGHWAGPKGQTREGTRGRGAGSPLGPAQQHLPVSLPKGSGHVARAQSAATVPACARSSEMGLVRGGADSSLIPRCQSQAGAVAGWDA